MVHATRALIEVLAELAAQEEPESITVDLSVTNAGDFEQSLAIPDETPVFSHFYHPKAAESVNAVFGMNLAIPPGRTHGRFISHPDGEMAVRREDDLHAVLLVAIPPWEPSSIRAFTRDGHQHDLTLVGADPPADEPIS